MKVLSSFLLTCIVATTAAQNGPGGIGSRNGSSDLLLWLSSSDFVTHGYQSGDGVHTWMDRSGRNAHTTVSGNPEFVPNTINGLPVISFESSSQEFLDGVLNQTPAAPLTIVAVANFNLNPQPGGQYVFGLGGNSSNQASISRQASTDAVPHAYYSYISPFVSPARSVGPSLTASQWYGFLAEYNSSNISSPYHRLYLNNAVQAIANDFPAAPTWGNTSYSIGRNSAGTSTSYLDGHVAELIVISRILNTAERTILFNYLSTKYAVAISNDLFAYDAVALGNFDLELAGVGAETGGSQTTATSGGLSITTNTGFDIGDYVLWAHRSAINTVNTFDIEEASETLTARWSRTWAIDVSNTGTPVSTNLSFNFATAGTGGTPSTTSNYYLVRSLGSGLGWELIASANNITGSSVNFNNVPLVDGIYTLATVNYNVSPLSNAVVSRGNGPGGIGSTTGGNLALWLDASQLTGLSNGAAVSTWPDLTTYARNATQVTGGDQPAYISNFQNGNGVVRFNGTSSNMSGTLGASFNAPFTLFVVSRFALANQGVDDNDYVFDLGIPVPLVNQVGVRASIARRRSNDAIARTNRYYSFQGDAMHYGPVISGNTFHSFGATYQLASPYHQLYLDGSLVLSAPGNASITTNGVYHLGRLNNTNDVNYFLNGDIAEVAVYNTVLSSSQIRIIQAYLSAKWGLTSVSDLYNGDTPAHGSNTLGITGVGRALDGDVGESESAGMTIRLSNDAAFESFLAIGHATATNSVNTSDVNGTIQERSNRAWYFTLTGNVGTATDLSFDFSTMGLSGTPGDPNNYVLIYRSGTSGTWSIVATANDTEGDQVYFSNVNLAATGSGFYTLASINSTPLPANLLSFNADVIDEEGDPTVRLHWVTASELNNAYYTVERSQDAQEWKVVGVMTGVGTSSNKNSYELFDTRPFAETSYYRLKQTDTDGTSRFIGGIQAVKIIDENVSVQIFPNPASDKITVIFSKEFIESAELVISDFSGRELEYQNLSPGISHTLMLKVPNGIYSLTIKTNTRVVHRQRFVIAH